ncbi:MAG: mechanosensitive ion channel [Flavobacteriales bacterium]|nr:mechanosensitive ion channel [Flavobacteriales bacterium]
MRTKLKTCVPFMAMSLSLLMAIGAVAQTDSLKQAKTDSLLSEKLEKGDDLLAKVDSTRTADSLQESSLEAQIAALTSADSQKKAELQARLDSLQTAQSEKELRVKAQVDSLRNSVKGIPVVLFEDTLFKVYAKIGPFTAAVRAENITKKLTWLVDDNLFDADLLKVIAGEESHDLVHDEIILLSITDRDAFWMDKSRAEVAESYKEIIIKGVSDYRDRTGLLHTAMRIGMLLLVLIVLFLIVRFLNKWFNILAAKAIAKSESLLNGVKFRNYEFLSKDRETQFLKWILNATKWIVIIVVVYLALPIVFSIFPATKGIASSLIGYVVDPFKMFFHAIVGYIPEMMTIGVISAITYQFVRFLRFMTNEIQSGKLVLPGFYPDWAEPTFSLIRVIVYAFAFIIIFPYLPGSDSPAFQGVSVFLGLLISMGSSSAISNIIAGLVITYMRAFKIGDRVKIGDTVGDVMEKTMLVTRLRTIKNEEVTIPNGAILNGSTVNYSTSAKQTGLILHTTITIGYDVPWRQVHQLMIDAALKTDGLNAEPKPFVFQTSLDDYYVSYQINAYTEVPETAAKIYSQLHANIQDGFNEAGVEILSPHYRAARDGNMVTTPPQYLPDNYKAPSFNVSMKKD